MMNPAPSFFRHDLHSGLFFRPTAQPPFQSSLQGWDRVTIRYAKVIGLEHAFNMTFRVTPLEYAFNQTLKGQAAGIRFNHTFEGQRPGNLSSPACRAEKPKHSKIPKGQRPGSFSRDIRCRSRTHKFGCTRSSQQKIEGTFLSSQSFASKCFACWLITLKKLVVSLPSSVVTSITYIWSRAFHEPCRLASL